MAATRVMGILNVTPDSFSDGGRWFEPEAAVAHGLRLFAEGADVVDVGGESTRPGAEPVPVAEERRRVVPVVEALAAHGPVSVDTRHAEVAEAAVAAGATIINDVSASLHEVAAASGAAWIAMHMKGTPPTMQHRPHYDDVVEEVAAFLADRAEAARSAGVGEVYVDPGLGFGKTAEHNLRLLHHLDRLVAAGHPVVVGASRKAFLGHLHAATDAGRAAGGLGAGARGEGAADLPPVVPDDRLEGSLAAAVWAAWRGAAMVRVHDVAATVASLRICNEEVAA